jgi:sulfane dehydrogenase subunit SoxC
VPHHEPAATAELPASLTTDPGISRGELELAARNHGMPLEALSLEVTPVGLHYLLIHYDVPIVDPATWRLAIDGAVARPLELSLDDLRARPSVTHRVTLECAGNGRARLSPRAISQPWLNHAIGTGSWTGVPLADLLDEAVPTDAAVELVFTGADRGVEGGVAQHYQRSLTLTQARREGVVLAYALNDAPLPPQHGAPVRLVVPGWYGMASVKWLRRVEAVTVPFDGYQQTTAYRWRATPDDPGTPMREIRVQSMLQPPGVPDFATRRRFLPAGPTTLAGRAWSGHGPVTDVAVSTDGGETWREATLEPPPGPHAWQRFSVTWDAPVGRHELCSRATDAAGRTQPLEPEWNVGGYGGNAVHRVDVEVTHT